MNKLHAHGGLSKQPSVNQLMGQQPQQHPTAPSSIAHMGKSLFPANLFHGTNMKISVQREPLLVEFFVFLLLLMAFPFLTGSNMLNHHMQANGDMNGGHSSQTIVSASHCSPPPPYNPDPSLVRYLTLQ